MPYPTEHAARIKSPDSFVPKSFRSKEIDSGIRIIIGKLKDGSGSMVTQAYRFSAEKFTSQEAKDWLKKHDISYLKFESASAESDKEGEMDKKELQHVGVLGMRWGHRKGTTEGGGTEGPSHVRNVSSDAAKAAAIRKKRLDEMTNEDIKFLSNRIELERKYKDLDPSGLTKTSKRVSSTLAVLATSGENIGKLITFGQKVMNAKGKA